MKNQGSIGVILLVIAGLVAIAAGVKLLSEQQIFKSKASEEKVENIIVFRGNTSCVKDQCEAVRDEIDVLISAPQFIVPTAAITPLVSPTLQPTDTVAPSPSWTESEEIPTVTETEVSTPEVEPTGTEETFGELLGASSAAVTAYRIWVSTAPSDLPSPEKGGWEEYNGPKTVRVKLPNPEPEKLYYVFVQFKYLGQNDTELESKIFTTPTPTESIKPQASTLPKPTNLSVKCISGGSVQLSWKAPLGVVNFWYKVWETGPGLGEPAGRGKFANLTNFVYVNIALNKDYRWKVMSGGANINEKVGDMSTDAVEGIFKCPIR